MIAFNSGDTILNSLDALELSIVSPELRKGKVISVDQKYSLAVFDIGRKDGVEKGKQCAILKDDKEIAQAEVISTRYNVSAAFIYETAYGHNIRDIKEGDGVLVTK